MVQSSKTKSIFVCSNCGNEFLAWRGQCSSCGEWNALHELKTQNSKFKAFRTKDITQPILLNEIKFNEGARISSGLSEFDRVLGGGIVSGSIGLIGGDPGIGKSTLLLQVAHQIPKILYVSGEESAEQIALRVKRLGLSGQIQFLAEIDVDRIIDITSHQKPNLVIIDSIQTMYDDSFPSTPGSIVQVRETALRFQQFAKQSNTAVILVGHVTKEGTVAGPRLLEHMIDYLLYIEGDQQHDLRILRSVKNRFGSTDEVGVFQMMESGFRQVINPSVLFISDRTKSPQVGSIMSVTVQGKRPFLVEIQALTAKTVFGYPKRTVNGAELNRVQLISVIIARSLGASLDSHDIYVSSIGGIPIKEPAIDLGIALAILSARQNIPLSGHLAAIGELDLTGRIRPVSQQKTRLDEVRRLGYDVISPDSHQTIQRLADHLGLTIAEK